METNRLAIVLAVVCLLCLLLALAIGAVVLAQSSASFNLDWNVVGSGGGESTSAGYRVNGTIGQSMAGPPPAGGGAFAVTSGYWVFDARRTLYLPAVTKQ